MVSVKGQQAEVLLPIQKKHTYESALWALCPAVFLSAGSMLAWIQLWGTLAPERSLPFLAVFVGVLTGWLADRLGKKQKFLKGLIIVPWLAVLVLTGFHGYGTGFLAWINVLIARWNEVQEAGIQLFRIHAGTDAVLAITLLAALLQGQLAWLLVRDRKMVGIDANCLFWLLLMLLEQNFSALSAALLFAAVLSARMSEKGMLVSRAGKWWTILLAGGLCIAALVMPGGTIQQMGDIRYQTAQGIRHLRYGKDLLPNGDLNLAGRLLAHDEDALKVQSGQSKDLYLKGFVGAVCKEGHWKMLPESAYGGENTGMQEWLRTQNFDPLTQTARYYQLGDSEEMPEENWMSVLTTGASRAYVYAPASLEEVTKGSEKEVQDLRLRSTGLRGESTYQFRELSGSRPAELMIADDWVYDPQTEEQKQYTEAEAVYRKFVYEQYTTVDDDLAALMQEFFWDDYDSENDGIYSALTQIRTRLSEEITYTEQPHSVPKGKEGFHWFLTEEKSGNAVWYASTAVEAFRAHGIPARYVEGYYVPSTSFADSADGTVTVTGENAHAWVEVYFDGIGWLPVDVTPGYYYSIVELQQMVGSPDAVHKTAALEDSIFGADEINDLGDNSGTKVPAPVKMVWNLMLILLGILAVLLVLLTVLFAVAELGRVLWIQRDKRKYQKASWQERVRVTEKNIYLAMAMLGIKASLGWNTEEVDEEVVQVTGTAQPGDYTRVCRLLEKAVYGGIEPEPYDERVMSAFRETLYQTGMEKELFTRLKFHYFGWYQIWRNMRK